MVEWWELNSGGGEGEGYRRTDVPCNGANGTCPLSHLLVAFPSLCLSPFLFMLILALTV